MPPSLDGALQRHKRDLQAAVVRPLVETLDPVSVGLER